MGDRKRVSVKEGKSVYTKEWEVEVRSYLVTSWYASS